MRQGPERPGKRVGAASKEGGEWEDTFERFPLESSVLTRALYFRIYVGNYVTQSTAKNFICPKRKAGRLQLP